MPKTSRKPVNTRKPKHTPLPLSSNTLVQLTKTKLIRKWAPRASPSYDTPTFDTILTEEILSCSICLQLLLHPVLAQCGHSFCLTCAEDLARHGFACGICHSHQPSYDLQHSSIIQTLLEDHLMQSKSEERELYQKRKMDLEKKQKNRRLGDVSEGEPVDFWCEDQFIWKSGIVAQIRKNGDLVITTKKGMEEISIPFNSRKLAPHRHFTKEESIPQMVEIPIQPAQFMGNFDNVRMRMDERPRHFGMPLFLGYYWRGEDMLDHNAVFDLEPFTF